MTRAALLQMTSRIDLLANARMTCRLFISSGIALPLRLVVTEGGLAVVTLGCEGLREEAQGAAVAGLGHAISGGLLRSTGATSFPSRNR